MPTKYKNQPAGAFERLDDHRGWESYQRFTHDLFASFVEVCTTHGRIPSAVTFHQMMHHFLWALPDHVCDSAKVNLPVYKEAFAKEDPRTADERHDLWEVIPQLAYDWEILELYGSMTCLRQTLEDAIAAMMKDSSGHLVTAAKLHNRLYYSIYGNPSNYMVED